MKVKNCGDIQASDLTGGPGAERGVGGIGLGGAQDNK